MMDSKATKLAAVVLCCLAAVAFGTIYTWTGEGSGPEWQDQYNWDPTDYSCTPNCYPHTIDDDALVDTVVTITLTADETIDDLQISEFDTTSNPTVFTTGGTVKTVECYSITISDAFVMVEELAVLKTVDEP